MNPGRDAWKRLGVLGSLAIAGYLLAGLSACAMASRIMYLPSYGSHRAPAGLQKIRVGDQEIAVLHLPNPAARHTLWFFHGNAEDLGDLEPFLRAIRDAGFAVFAFDYPGYGLSTGRPSEEALYEAARAARKHLRETLRVPAERTIIYGRSLGGGPAVQMAVEERPAGLVLQSAFVSAFRVLTRWRLLPFDQFENLPKMVRVKCPVLVMHGRLDEVIPLRQGEALFAAAPDPKRSLWIDRAMHNDFIDAAGRGYWDALREFSELCARANGSNP